MQEAEVLGETTFMQILLYFQGQGGREDDALWNHKCLILYVRWTTFSLHQFSARKPSGS